MSTPAGPVIATNDTHYLRREDVHMHKGLVGLGTPAAAVRSARA